MCSVIVGQQACLPGKHHNLARTIRKPLKHPATLLAAVYHDATSGRPGAGEHDGKRCLAAAGLYLARTGRMARGYLIGGGAIYLVLWIYGLITSSNMAADFVPMNSADNWLHLVLGVAMIGLGLWLGRDATEEAKGSTT